jgi:hypothetical protein
MGKRLYMRSEEKDRTILEGVSNVNILEDNIKKNPQ